MGSGSTFNENPIYWGNVTYNKDSKREYLGNQPSSVKSYFDRSETIEEIKKLFDGQIHVVVLHGRPGLGKSALAKLFFQQYEKQYKQKGWVDYGTNICKSIVKAFDFHGTEIGGRKNDRLYEKLANSEIIWLKNHPQKRLIIVKGITDWEDIIRHLHFFELEETHYLLTAPNPFPKHVDPHYKIKYQNVPVPLISKKEVKEIFNHFCKYALPDHFIEKLHGNLFLINLVLKQTPIPNPKYIHEFFESVFNEVHTEEELLHSVFDHYNWSGAELWTLLQIAALPQFDFDAVDLAQYIASEAEEIEFLIGFEKFKTKNPDLPTADSYALSDILKRLADRGWLHETEGEEFSFHPILRNTLQKKQPLDVSFFHELSNTLTLAFFTDTSDLILDDLKYEEHLRAFLDFIPEQAHELYIQNLSKLIVLEERNGHYYEELALREKHLALLQQYSDTDNQRYVQALVDIAGCYLRCGKLQEAERCARESLAIGEHLPINLGGCYTIVGLVEKAKSNLLIAKDWLLKALASAEKNFGKDHPSTARSYSNLALVLQDLGDYEGAKGLLQKALASGEKNFGKDHPSTAISYSNLALVLQALGDYEGAKGLLQKALASDEKNFGKGHPSTAGSYSNLALVLQALGDYEGAKELLEKAVASDKKNFGIDHPATAIRYSNLALVLKDLGEYEGAKGLLQKALASDEKNFGKEHPSTARSYSNLANVYFYLKEYKKAEELMQVAISIFQKVLPANHPHITGRKKDLEIIRQAMRAG